MFAKPKVRDSQVEKAKTLTSNSPQRNTQRKNYMAHSVRYTDYTGSAGCGGFDSPNFYQHLQTLNSPTQEKRLEKLEDRMSILSSQYDQFIPLIGLLDQANTINRADTQIKKIQKKQIECEDKLSSFQLQLSQVQKSVDIVKMQYLNGSDFSAKSLTQSIKKEKAHHSNVPDNEQQINQIVKTQSLKLQDHFQHNINDLKEEIYQKLNVQNRQIEDFRSLFSNETQGIQQTLAQMTNNYSAMLNSGKTNNEHQQQFGELHKYVDMRIQEQINLLRDSCEKEFIHLQRDIGVISVYQQLNTDLRRRDKLSNILVIPDNLDKFERLLKINNAEQGVLLGQFSQLVLILNLKLIEMDQFNKENCQRLINELRNLEERVDVKQERLQLSINRFDQSDIENTKKEVDMMYEQFNFLKSQIDGTRKISVCELKRIEDKMEQIDNIRGKISNDPNEKKDLQRITLDIKKSISFQEKISKLIEHIDENLKIVTEFQAKVDEKLDNIQQDIYKR